MQPSDTSLAQTDNMGLVNERNIMWPFILPSSLRVFIQRAPSGKQYFRVPSGYMYLFFTASVNLWSQYPSVKRCPTHFTDSGCAFGTERHSNPNRFSNVWIGQSWKQHILRLLSKSGSWCVLFISPPFALRFQARPVAKTETTTEHVPTNLRQVWTAKKSHQFVNRLRMLRGMNI